jgi:hypothetical protein
MSDAMAIAAAGIRSAEVKFTNAAEKIVTNMPGGARALTGPPSQPVTPVAASQQSGQQQDFAGSSPDHDVAVQMARMIEAKFGFRANIAVFHAADRMAKTTVNIVI